jgi:small redox-active disulfide protein 2
MEIAVLGSGCKNCEALEAATHEALSNLGIDQEIKKITDFGEIASYGVMKTPALVIDGTVVVKGRVPPAAEVASLVTAAIG